MTVPMEVPSVCPVKTDYFGPNCKHIVALSGDNVVVCAWTQDHTTAFAYSEKNPSIGKIPTCCLDLEDLRPAVFDGVYLALENQDVSLESFWDLRWDAGDHIKVYKWLDQSNGIGLNLATGKIGVFGKSKEELKLILHNFT
ncbi:hypothetical protein V8E54_003733 [Elaphomyces granulatus]